MASGDEEKLRKAIKREAAKIRVKPALGKIRQRIKGQSPKNPGDKKAGDK